MRKWSYRLLQCSWGLPQTLLGLMVCVWYRNAPHEDFLGAVRTRWPRRDGISLGLFIFSPDLEDMGGRMAVHEYGHTVQSLILGPLYLLLIGLPSAVWYRCFRGYRKKRGLSYSSFWTERWADTLGDRYCGARGRDPRQDVWEPPA